jgi:aspartyl-tRNA(Asn)/glutamyl-tRNA(Gln) amidotransferase subunit C
MVPEDEVRHVADLARLGLTNDEVKKMGEELWVILESVEQIGKLDLSGVPPTANTSNSTNVFRPDEPDVPLQCLPRGKALSPAPEAMDGLFAVPRID